MGFSLIHCKKNPSIFWNQINTGFFPCGAIRKSSRCITCNKAKILVLVYFTLRNTIYIFFLLYCFYLYFYSYSPQYYNLLSSSIIAGRFLYFTFHSSTICPTTFEPPFIFCILLRSDTIEE